MVRLADGSVVNNRTLQEVQEVSRLHLQITALDNNNVTYIIPEKLKLLYSDNDMLESINYNNNKNTFLLLESTVELEGFMK